MGVLAKGVAIAAVVAGPSLYSLFKAGDLDFTQAFERGAVVAVGAAVGVTFIEQLLDTYRRDALRRDALRHIPEDEGDEEQDAT